MTIKDIARECGCGIGTVSRVLNNHPDVSKQMRERVLAVVSKHNFVTNQSAKLLRAQDTKAIAILVKGTSNILLNVLVERMQKRIEQLPYTTNVIILDEYDNEAEQAGHFCRWQKPAGMIFAGGNPELKKEAFGNVQVPCVIVANQAEDVSFLNLSSVSTDDTEASYRIATYLIANGHTNIGVIGGDLNCSHVAQHRFEGFLKAMAEHGLLFSKATSYMATRYSLAGGAEAAEKLVTANKNVTALFTMSDVMAIGAIRRLTDMGYKVPEDISITGFDGLDITEFYCPRITTIRQRIDAIAEVGVDVLLKGIERNDLCSHQYVPFDFIAGESVKNMLAAKA